MGDERWRRMWKLFDEVAELPEGEHPGFLEDSEPDPELRAEVADLLAHRREQFLESPAALDLAAPSDSFGPGERVGPYELEEVLGEGGMGVVYAARQLEPVERRVALKVIKPGMDTRRVVRRFEAERQSLAQMEHSHIARVLDGGATADGRPFFVMELVAGEPLTEYCDARRLPVDRRLELFLDVCMAVQHAHQKGLVHRDLKPSNLLVAEEDGRPMPKVIDFGIAKAMEESGDGTRLTLDGRMLGTPEYMSPEQCAGDSGVDTRADIYSLGVVLYELLAGRLPFERDDGGGVSELQRRIREEEPPRPSAGARFSREAAEARGTDPAILASELRGDLDWIVAKALEKDPARRYASASELASDVRRALAHEPVLAGPPSASYRLRKLVRRHRVAVSAVVAAVLALLVGLAGTTWMAVVAERERAAAEEARAAAEREAATAEAINDFLQRMLAAPDPWRGASVSPVAREARVADVLARAGEVVAGAFPDQPVVDAAVRHTLGVTQMNLGLLDEAAPHLEAAYQRRREILGADHPDTLTALNDLAAVHKRRGNLDTAGRLWEEALAGRRRILGERHPETLATRLNRAEVLYHLGHLDEAMAAAEEVWKGGRDGPGAAAEVTMTAQNLLAAIHNRRGESERAEELYGELWELQRETLGPDHPMTLSTQGNVATTLYRLGRAAAAVEIAGDVVDRHRRVLGPRHEETLKSLANLGAFQMKAGRLPEAEATFREALTGLEATVGSHHPQTVIAHNNLARAILDRGDAAAAVAEYRSFLPTASRVLEGHFNLHLFRTGYGLALTRLGSYTEAEAELLAAWEGLHAALGPDHPRTFMTAERLADLYEEWERPEEAAHWRQGMGATHGGQG